MARSRAVSTSVPFEQRSQKTVECSRSEKQHEKMLRKIIRFFLWWIYFCVGMAVLAAIAFWGGYFVLEMVTSGEAVTMPDLYGRTRAEAIVELTSAGLKLKLPIEQQPHDEYPQDTVIAHSPRPGEKVKSGRLVRLVVSMGAQLVEIPNVVALDEADAAGTLASQGLELRDKARIHHPTVPPGEVIAQDPTPGERLLSGRGLSVLVSLGPAPEAYVMPDLINRDYLEVHDRLQQWGFEVESPPRLEPTEERESVGRVLDTEPRPGERVTENDLIALVMGTMGRRTEQAFWANIVAELDGVRVGTLNVDVLQRTRVRAYELVIRDDWATIGPDGEVIPRIVEMSITPGPGDARLNTWVLLSGEATVEVRETLPGFAGKGTLIRTEYCKPPASAATSPETTE